jgi:Holliday junction DNA helicase RuvA
VITSEAVRRVSKNGAVSPRSQIWTDGMIGKLKGLVEGFGEDHVIVDVQGVGYLVFCSSRTLQHLPPIGGAVALFIETQVREDAIRLFGFAAEIERDWFRLLQNVQGVGAKVALAILAVLTARELAAAIAIQDKTALLRASGVGQKLAARIVAELKDKAPAGSALDPARTQVPAAPPGTPQPVQDAISALVNLGYGRPQAITAVLESRKALGDAAETAALVRRGLKELAS